MKDHDSTNYPSFCSHRSALSSVVPVSVFSVYLLSFTLFYSLSTSAESLSVSNTPIKYGVTDYLLQGQDAPPMLRAEYALIDALAKQLDSEVELVNCSFENCVEMLGDGAIDVMSFITPTKERRENITLLSIRKFVKPKPELYIKSGSGVSLVKFEDLYSLSLGLVDGWGYPDAILKNPNIKRVYASSEAKLAKLVSTGEIDVFVRVYLSENFVVKIFPELTRAEYSPPPPEMALYAVRKQPSNRSEEIIATVEYLEASGKVDAILESFDLEFSR